MDLDIKIIGLEDVFDQDVFDYYEDLAETLKVTYSRAYPDERDYHFKKLTFTLIVKANLKGRCFVFVGIEGDYNQNKHDHAMLVNDVKVFFKPI